jgi:hypothetical protein
VIGDPAAAERELRRLSAEGVDAAAARLGPLEVSRYAGLRTRPGTSGTAYLLHTTGRSVLIVCEVPAAGGGGALAACTRAASTVGLRGERPLSPAAAAERRGPAVRAALAQLNSERLAARRRIAAAERAEEQAAATRELQVSYEKAGARVAEIGMPGTQAADLLAGLAGAAAAYGGLAAAISVGDQPGYDGARAAVHEAEAIVWSTIAELPR